MPVAEPGGEVVAGAVVVGEECSEGGAGLVGVLVDGLALEADGAGASVPHALFEVVVHGFGVFAKPVEGGEVGIVFGDWAPASGAAPVVGALGGVAVVADHGSCDVEVVGAPG